MYNVYFNYENEGESGSSTFEVKNDQDLIENLKYLNDRHGEIVLVYATESYLHFKPLSTIEHQEKEDKIEEINKLIRKYIKNKAIDAGAHIVLARGDIKGIFGDRSRLEFKKMKLVRDGYEENEIEVIPVSIDSYKNVQ